MLVENVIQTFIQFRFMNTKHENGGKCDYSSSLETFKENNPFQRAFRFYRTLKIGITPY